jgi:hypothetical protein
VTDSPVTFYDRILVFLFVSNNKYVVVIYYINSMLSAAVIVTAHDFSPGVQNSYSLGDFVQHLWFSGKQHSIALCFRTLVNVFRYFAT